MKIMIVDDNADTRTLLAEQLLKLGFDAVMCGNGREALDLYPLEAPDVVVMDIAMPQMDGLEATEQICMLDPEACVIVMTAYSEDMLRRAAYAAGASEYYLKDNFDPMLAQIVRKLQHNGVRA